MDIVIREHFLRIMQKSSLKIDLNNRGVFMSEEKNNKLMLTPESITYKIVIHQLLSGKMKETDDLHAINAILRRMLNEDYHNRYKK